MDKLTLCRLAGPGRLPERIVVIASIGSATFDQLPDFIDAAPKAADQPVCRAKNNGGDCVVSA